MFFSLLHWQGNSAIGQIQGGAGKKTSPNAFWCVRAVTRAHQGTTRPSRKKPPVGPSSGTSAAQTTDAAPSRTGRPPGPPISVRTQPGQTEFTRILVSGAASAASIRVSALSPALLTRYAGIPRPGHAQRAAGCSRPSTIRPCSLRRAGAGRSALRDPPGAEQVRLERLAHDRQVGRGGLLVRVVMDRGVVNQHVDAAEPLAHEVRECTGAGRVGDVEAVGDHISRRDRPPRHSPWPGHGR